MTLVDAGHSHTLSHEYHNASVSDLQVDQDGVTQGWPMRMKDMLMVFCPSPSALLRVWGQVEQKGYSSQPISVRISVSFRLFPSNASSCRMHCSEAS